MADARDTGPQVKAAGESEDPQAPRKPRKLQKRAPQAPKASTDPEYLERQLQDAKNKSRASQLKLRNAEASTKSAAEELLRAERHRRFFEGRKQSLESKKRDEKKDRAQVDSRKHLLSSLRPHRPSFDADESNETEYADVRALILESATCVDGRARSLQRLLRQDFGFFTASEKLSLRSQKSWTPTKEELYQRGLVVENRGTVLYYVHYIDNEDRRYSDVALSSLRSIVPTLAKASNNATNHHVLVIADSHSPIDCSDWKGLENVKVISRNEFCTSSLTRGLINTLEAYKASKLSDEAPNGVSVGDLIMGLQKDLPSKTIHHWRSSESSTSLFLKPNALFSQSEGESEFYAMPINPRPPREHKEVHVLSIRWSESQEILKEVPKLSEEVLEKLVGANEYLQREQLESAFKRKVELEKYTTQASQKLLSTLLRQAYFCEVHEIFLESDRFDVEVYYRFKKTLSKLCDQYGDDPDDLLIIHYSGHGGFDSETEERSTPFILAPVAGARGRLDFGRMMEYSHDRARCDTLYILNCCDADGAVASLRLHEDITEDLSGAIKADAAAHTVQYKKEEVLAACSRGNLATTYFMEGLEAFITRHLRAVLKEGPPVSISHLQARISTEYEADAAPVRVAIAGGSFSDDSIILQPCYNKVRKDVAKVMAEEPPLKSGEIIVVILKHTRTDSKDIADQAITLVCSQRRRMHFLFEQYADRVAGSIICSHGKYGDEKFNDINDLSMKASGSIITLAQSKEICVGDLTAVDNVVVCEALVKGDICVEWDSCLQHLVEDVPDSALKDKSVKKDPHRLKPQVYEELKFVQQDYLEHAFVEGKLHPGLFLMLTLGVCDLPFNEDRRIWWEALRQLSHGNGKTLALTKSPPHIMTSLQREKQVHGEDNSVDGDDETPQRNAHAAQNEGTTAMVLSIVSAYVNEKINAGKLTVQQRASRFIEDFGSSFRPEVLARRAETSFHPLGKIPEPGDRLAVFEYIVGSGVLADKDTTYDRKTKMAIKQVANSCAQRP